MKTQKARSTPGAQTPQTSPSEVGAEMYRWASDLFPICRSLTGDGVRETLAYLGRLVPSLTVHEVPSGTEAFDWTVPDEWNIRDAFIEDESGRRVVDFSRSNLHVVGYSTPVDEWLTLEELQPHLHSLPDQPDAIPYVTSYYAKRWGFCLPHSTREALPDGRYHAVIDSTLEPGSLTYGEVLIPGRDSREILLSTYICHPSLANDNLAGATVAAFAGRLLGGLRRRYSYRLLFVPGTIGSIAWLAQNEATVGRIAHGLVLACLGDGGHPTFKQSRRGDAEIDRVAGHVLRHRGAHDIAGFSPYGYDERQYCSPGFDLPVGCLMRTPHGRYPEYHTSADNLDLVRPEALADSLDLLLEILEVLEHNRTYVSQNLKCEPQLGKRGLYRSMGGLADAGVVEMALLWVLSLSDGQHSLLDIAERAGQAFDGVHRAAELLVEHGLLKEAAV